MRFAARDRVGERRIFHGRRREAGPEAQTAFGFRCWEERRFGERPLRSPRDLAQGRRTSRPRPTGIRASRTGRCVPPTLGGEARGSWQREPSTADLATRARGRAAVAFLH